MFSVPDKNAQLRSFAQNSTAACEYRAAVLSINTFSNNLKGLIQEQKEQGRKDSANRPYSADGNVAHG